MDQAHPYIKNEFLAELFRPKRIVFIVNPRAGTNMQKNIRTSVDKHLSHTKFQYGFKFTEYAGHASILAKEAIEEGYEIIVAVGGDGSINEVASAVMNTEATLAIVPAGSGNGLAMHLGYGRGVDAAIKKLNNAQEKTIDMGLLNDRPFVNLAGIGFDGLVSNLMKGSNWRGFVPYFFKSVKAGLQYTPQDCLIETENGNIQAKCFAISIANGPMYGYNVRIAPDALLDDGYFEVVVLKDAPKWQYFAAVPSTFTGNIYDADFVEHIHAKHVKISSPGINFVHVDGEGMTIEGDLEFKIQHKCLKILVPLTEE